MLISAPSPLPPHFFTWMQLCYFAMHHVKGTAVWVDQGQYGDDTFWEQIDGGRPWTPTRKVLLVVPVLLYVQRLLGVLFVCLFVLLLYSFTLQSSCSKSATLLHQVCGACTRS